MYESHYYTQNKVCPCKIGEGTIKKSIDIYSKSTNIASFVEELERQRIIGKKIWFDKTENTIFITKVYACESGGGCPDNKNVIGEASVVIASTIITRKSIILNTTVSAEPNFTGRCLYQSLVIMF